MLLLLPLLSAVAVVSALLLRWWCWSWLVQLAGIADAVVCAVSEGVFVDGAAGVLSPDAWSTHSGSPLRLITWMSTSTPWSLRATACAGVRIHTHTHRDDGKSAALLIKIANWFH